MVSSLLTGSHLSADKQGNMRGFGPASMVILLVLLSTLLSDVNALNFNRFGKKAFIDRPRAEPWRRMASLRMFADQKREQPATVLATRNKKQYR